MAEQLSALTDTHARGKQDRANPQSVCDPVWHCERVE
jgi:hypothetical protein